jgi:hypothetical protein
MALAVFAAIALLAFLGSYFSKILLPSRCWNRALGSDAPEDCSLASTHASEFASTARLRRIFQKKWGNACVERTAAWKEPPREVCHCDTFVNELV